MLQLRWLIPVSLVAILLASISTVVLMGQANIPSTKPPDIASMSPAFKKAVDEVQKQCPTCATIDLASGQKAWVVNIGQTRSQIDLSDGCHLASWTKQQSDTLRTTLEKSFSGDQLESFLSHTPKDCEQKAFVYYLGVARQLLGKVKPQ